MKKLLLIVAVVGLLAAPAMAGMVKDVSLTLGNQLNDGGRASVRTYSNTTTVVGSYQLGDAGLDPNGVPYGQTNEVGDDITLVAGAGTYLAGLTWSVVNLNATATLVSCNTAITFYNSDGTPLIETVYNLYNGFNFGSSTYNLAPGYGYTAWGLSNGLQSEGYILPSNPGYFYMATTFWGSVWSGGTGTDNDLGVFLCNPPTIGSSADGMMEFFPNFGNSIYFSGNPVANMSYRVYSDVVPEPMTVMLLGLGALALIRRR